ncbi:hypothetical protein Droror1_Dr00017907 [Drosera rotundifolia]
MWLPLDFDPSLQEFVDFMELARRKEEERASNFVGLQAERFVDCERWMLFVDTERGRAAWLRRSTRNWRRRGRLAAGCGRGDVAKAGEAAGRDKGGRKRGGRLGWCGNREEDRAEIQMRKTERTERKTERYGQNNALCFVLVSFHVGHNSSTKDTMGGIFKCPHPL